MLFRRGAKAGKTLVWRNAVELAFAQRRVSLHMHLGNAHLHELRTPLSAQRT